MQQMPPYFPMMQMPGMPGFGAGVPGMPGMFGMPGQPSVGGPMGAAMGGMPAPPVAGGVGLGGMSGVSEPHRGRKGGGGGGGGSRKGSGGSKGGGRGKVGAPRSQGSAPMSSGALGGMPAPLPVAVGGAGGERKFRGGEGDGRRGGGKGKDKSGGGKGRWVYRDEHEPLTEEQLAERRRVSAERHAARVTEEERRIVTDLHIEGVVVQRARRHAWLKPNDPSTIPEEVRAPLRQMNEEFRAKAVDGRAFCDGIAEEVLYLAVADIAEQELMLSAGMPIKFKVYLDTKGVGACEVISNGPAPEVVAA